MNKRNVFIIEYNGIKQSLKTPGGHKVPPQGPDNGGSDCWWGGWEDGQMEDVFLQRLKWRKGEAYLKMVGSQLKCGTLLLVAVSDRWQLIIKPMPLGHRRLGYRYACVRERADIVNPRVPVDNSGLPERTLTKLHFACFLKCSAFKVIQIISQLSLSLDESQTEPHFHFIIYYSWADTLCALNVRYLLSVYPNFWVCSTHCHGALKLHFQSTGKDPIKCHRLLALHVTPEKSS